MDEAGTALAVYIRYQDVERGEIVEVSETFAPSDFLASVDQSSSEFRLIAAVAEYAEILRDSYWAKDSSLADAQTLALSAETAFANNNQVAEFLALLEQANQLMTDPTNP